jgi:uncharacterized RDD family membrane protein YckC
MTQNVTRFRLFAACVYELLLLLALWMLCTWMFVSLFGDATSHYKRTFLQLFLWLVTGAYFVWCWTKTGQTLATKTWKIKLVTQNLANQQNVNLNKRQAIIRYALASASILACGLGFIWALVDKDRLFLHDRLLKMRFISVA